MPASSTPRHYDLELSKVAELLYAEYKTSIKKQFDLDLSFSLVKIMYFLLKKSLSIIDGKF